VRWRELGLIFHEAGLALAQLRLYRNSPWIVHGAVGDTGIGDGAPPGQQNRTVNLIVAHSCYLSSTNFWSGAFRESSVLVYEFVIYPHPRPFSRPRVRGLEKGDFLYGGRTDLKCAKFSSGILLWKSWTRQRLPSHVFVVLAQRVQRT